MLSDVWMGSIRGLEIAWQRFTDVGHRDESAELLKDSDSPESAELVDFSDSLDLSRKKHHKHKKKKKRRRKKKHDVPAPRKGHLALYVEVDDRQLMVRRLSRFFFRTNLQPLHGSATSMQ